MSYSEWLNSISQIIPSIINWISSLTNSLIGNYIIVTILGFVLFYSFMSFVMYLLSSTRKSNKTDFDNIR